MRMTIPAVILPLLLAGVGGASAQNAPSPPAGPEAAEPANPGLGQVHAHGRHMWDHGRGGWRHHMGFAPGTFALFHPPANRQLSPADVQEIAQAILLWNGEHAWKVTDVQPAGGERIGFAYATQDGTVIARFVMNSTTGRIVRVG